jgi:hypothetical protein
MKRLIWLLLLTPCFGQIYPYRPPAPSSGNPAYAQTPWSCGTFATNPSCTATSGSSASSGDVLVAYYWGGSGVTFNTPTGCSTWSLVNFNSGSLQAFYIGTVTSTGSCAVTGTGNSSGGQSMNFLVFEIAHAIATVDQFNYTTDMEECNSCTGPSITTTVSNDMVISVSNNCTGTITANSPFSLDLNVNQSGNPLMTMHDVQGSAGAISATWTATGGCGIGTAVIAVEP